MNISNIKIYNNPKIQFREFTENDDYNIILDKIKRPFITTQNIILKFKIDNKVFYIPIQKGFIFDGATILNIFVPIIGESSDIRFIKASLIHDYFLNHRSEIYPKYFKHILNKKEFINLTTVLFNNILKQNHVSNIKSNIMSCLVNTWQLSIFNNKKWSVLNEDIK